MTALQNVLVGLHHTFRSNLLDVALHLPRFRARGARRASARAMRCWSSSACESLAGEEARNLPYGKQRLLEIAPRAGAQPASCCCWTSRPPA